MWMTASLLGLALALAPDAPEPERTPHAKARLISEDAALVAGSTQTLGIDFVIDKGWHLYFNGLPGTGNPPKINNSMLPPGVTLGEIQWPAPSRHISPGDIYDSVYFDRVTLLLPVTVAPNATPVAASKITLELEWLECSDVCMFGAATVGLEIPILAPGSPTTRSPEAPLIAKSRATLPQPLAADSRVRPTLTNDGQFNLRAMRATRIEFYPGPSCSEIDGMPEATLALSDSMSFRLVDRERPGRVQGVIGVWQGEGSTPAYFAIDVRPKP